MRASSVNYVIIFLVEKGTSDGDRTVYNGEVLGIVVFCNELSEKFSCMRCMFRRLQFSCVVGMRIPLR